MLYHILMVIESDVHICINIQAFFLADVKVRLNNHTLYPIQLYPIPGKQFWKSRLIMKSD